MESYKKRRPNIKLIAAALGVLALVCVGVVVLVLGGGSGDTPVKMPITQAAEYGFTEKGILAIEGGVLSYYTLSGEKQWEVPLTDEGCKLATASNYCAVYTQNVVQALNTEGTSLFPSIEFSGEILSVRCGPAYIAVYKTENDGSRYIYIYDLKGVRIDRLELQSNAMLDYGFDPDRGNFYTLMVNTDSSLPVCTISTYNIANSSDNGSMTKEGQIIEKVYFGNSRTYAVGTNQLITYTSTGKEEASSLIYGWRVMDFSAGSSPIALLCVRQETKTSATVAAKLLYLNTGAEYGFRLSAGTVGAYFYNGKVLVVQSTRLSYYDLKGNPLNSKELEFTVDSVENHGGRLVLKSGDDLYLMN